MQRNAARIQSRSALFLPDDVGGGAGGRRFHPEAMAITAASLTRRPRLGLLLISVEPTPSMNALTRRSGGSRTSTAESPDGCGGVTRAFAPMLLARWSALAGGDTMAAAFAAMRRSHPPADRLVHLSSGPPFAVPRPGGASANAVELADNSRASTRPDRRGDKLATPASLAWRCSKQATLTRACGSLRRQ